MNATTTYTYIIPIRHWVKKGHDSENDSDDEEEEIAEMIIADVIWEGNIPSVRIPDIEAVVTIRTVSATLVSNLLHFELF